MPETRFERVLVMAEPEPAGGEPKATPSAAKMDKTAVSTASLSQHIEGEGMEADSSPKKTYLQHLSLWSGTPSESFFSIFIRPVFMIGYPAVIWATIGCEYHDAYSPNNPHTSNV